MSTDYSISDERADFLTRQTIASFRRLARGAIRLIRLGDAESLESLRECRRRSHALHAMLIQGGR